MNSACEKLKIHDNREITLRGRCIKNNDDDSCCEPILIMN